MALRPVFVPDEQPPFVKEVPVQFNWVAGMSKSQVQKCVISLHEAAKRRGIDRILEISSKSTTSLGIKLSAFYLMLTPPQGQTMSVECAFQGSKVFTGGGPFTDLYTVSSREAKKDVRLRNSGELIGFNFLGENFPTIPRTAFYDWLYLNALVQNPNLARELLRYNAFTDIAFNPQKSINCQARAAALFTALSRMGEVDRVIKDKDYYLKLISAPSRKPITGQKGRQERLL